MKFIFLPQPTSTSMVSFHHLIVPIAALTLFLLPPSAKAGETVQPAEARRAGYDLEIVDGTLALDGKKVEATLANVVDALRSRYQEANIALAPSLGKLNISDLKLRAGPLIDELEAVRVASGDKFVIQGPGGAPAIDPNTGLPVKDGANSGLFVLQQAPATAQTERCVEAFNLDPYLTSLRRGAPLTESAQDRAKREQLSIDELTMMVGETIAMMKNEAQPPEPPVFRFHRGASVLVVIGSRESVDVAGKIVNALPGMTGTPQRTESEGAERARAAAMEAFRKRYGLDRSSQDPSVAPPPGPAQK